MIRATNVNWSNVIDFIGTESIVKVKAEDLSLPRIQHMSKCTIFDVKKTFNNRSNSEDIFLEIKYKQFKSGKKIKLTIFRKVEGYGISIFVLDRSRKVSRTLNTEFQSYSGADIKLADTNVSMIKKYVLNFKQKHCSPEVRNCVDYPSEKYESYEECDKEFVKQKTKEIGVVPFWATDNYGEVTTIAKHITNPDTILWELFYGSLESPCKYVIKYFLAKPNHLFSRKPCLATKTIGVKIQSIGRSTNSSSIALSFLPSVTRNSIYFPPFNWTSFLSDLGGSLGLWMGLGILQILEMVIDLNQFCKTKNN